MGYTAVELIASTKKRGQFPTSAGSFNEADYLRLMDEELRTKLVPQMMTVRENYFLYSSENELEANVSSYEINGRAIGLKLKDLFYLQQGTQPQKMYQVDLEQILQFGFEGSGQNTGQGNPIYYYFEDNFIKVLPVVGGNPVGSIRQYFFQRRNTLIATTACGQITAISVDRLTATLNNVPTTFTTAVDYDVVKATPGFRNLGIDLEVTNVAGSDVTFAGPLPDGTVTGDYVCLATESPIPQIPLEMFPCLAQRLVYAVCCAVKDIQGSARAEAQFNDLMTESLRLISTRTDAASKTFVSPDSLSSQLAGGGFGWGINGGRW